MTCQQLFVVCITIPNVLPFTRQNLETRGMSSQAGSFMLVTGKQRAALPSTQAVITYAILHMHTWCYVNPATNMKKSTINSFQQ